MSSETEGWMWWS